MFDIKPDFKQLPTRQLEKISSLMAVSLAALATPGDRQALIKRCEATYGALTVSLEGAIDDKASPPMVRSPSISPRDKPPKPASRLKHVGHDTLRAQVLNRMTGDMTFADIDRELGFPKHKSALHAHDIWKNVGVGYKVAEDGKVLAVFPAGKTLADVVL